MRIIQGVSKKRGIKELNIKTMQRTLQNKHQIFKILVSIPHNYYLIMGDRHKNFEDPMFFLQCPLYSFYIQFLIPPCMLGRKSKEILANIVSLRNCLLVNQD
jgi:hypothetical protein